MHARYRAVFLYTGFEFHQHRMASAVTIENFFACKADLYRSVKQQSRLRHHDFVVEGIAFAAETATVWCGNYANVRRRHFKHFRQRAMQIMRCLRTRPDGQLAVGVLDGHRSMLLDGKVRVSLIKEGVLENFLRFRKSLLHVSE